MLPTFTCLFSLTHKRSAGSSVIPRWSSIRSRSLPRKETPPPGRSVFPKRNRAIHDSTPVVRAALPGLHGGNLNRAPAVTREGRGGEKNTTVPTCSLPPLETGWVRAPAKHSAVAEATPGSCSVSGGGPVPVLLKSHTGAQRRRRADPKDRGSRAATLQEPQQGRSYRATLKHSPLPRAACFGTMRGSATALAQPATRETFCFSSPSPRFSLPAAQRLHEYGPTAFAPTEESLKN